MTAICASIKSVNAKIINYIRNNPQRIAEIALMVANIAATSFFSLSGSLVGACVFGSVSVVSLTLIVARSSSSNKETVDNICKFMGNTGMLASTGLIIAGAFTVNVPLLFTGFAGGCISILKMISTSSKW
jgi:hypothetical protein